MPFTRNKLAAALGALQTDVTAIAEAELKTTVSGLLNLVETLSAENEALKPVVPQHQTLLDDFLTQYWIFYHRLNAFKNNPDAEQVTSLSQAFDALFSTQTGYAQLDERIAKTQAKRDE
jgi:hypothetical protein